MKLKYSLRPYEVAFRQEFLTSKTATVLRRGLFVLAESEDGTRGVGEIAPLEHFSDESLEAAHDAAAELIHRAKASEVPNDVSQIAAYLDECVDENLPPSVVFGFETAISDVIAKSKGVPLAHCIDPASTRHVPVNAVMSGKTDSIDQGNLAGFSSVKIKVSAGSADDDIRRIQLARGAIGEGGSIRLDANRAWKFDNAVTALSQMRDLGIEYVEEPLQEADLSRVDELYSRCEVPIALDETVRDKDMFECLVQSDAVTAIILKPTILGGIARSRQIIEHAQRFDKKAVITSTLETGIGVAACLHLAASMGSEALPCGLDTLRYLSDSFLDKPLLIVDGGMALPDGPGLGVTLRSEAAL